jgi:hypothetical protein
MNGATKIGKSIATQADQNNIGMKQYNGSFGMVNWIDGDWARISSNRNSNAARPGLCGHICI